MKKIFALILLCTTQPSYAGLVKCPKNLQDQPRALRILNYLATVQGHHHVGSCKVEIHTCAGFSEDTGDAVGDVLVTSEAGEETYMVIYLPHLKSPKVTVRDSVTDEMYHYEYENRVGSKVTGHLESNRVEFMRDPKTNRLESVSMGTYNTRDGARHLSQYTFTWNECGLAEHHPAKFTIPTEPDTLPE